MEALLLLGFGEPMGDREVSRLGRVDEVGVVPPCCESMRRGGSRGEAIVDILFALSKDRVLPALSV